MKMATDTLAKVDDAQSLARQQDLEKKVVWGIVAAAGELKGLEQFQRDWFERSGQPRLTSDWIRFHYPKFPLRIVVRRFTEDPLPLWPDVFTRFTKTPIFMAYKKWRSENDLDDCHNRLGMVFNAGPELMMLTDSDEEIARPKMVRQIGHPPVALSIVVFKAYLQQLIASGVPHPLQSGKGSDDAN